MKINSKLFFLGCFFSCFLLNIQAQQVYIETGLSNAQFKDYENSAGENTLDLNYSKPQKIFFEMGGRYNLYQDKIRWDFGVGYHTYQINTGFFAGKKSIPAVYELSYASVKTGINVSLLELGEFKFQVHSHISHDWLTSGTNNYLDVVVDLYEAKTFDKTLIRYHIGASIEYRITETIATYINYNMANSFRDKNKDSNNGEKYTFNTNAFSLGMLFYLQKNN